MNQSLNPLRRIRWGLLLAFLLSVVFSEAALAGGTTLKGTIKEIGTDYMYIGDYKVLLTDATLYYNKDYQAVTLDYFSVGMTVQALVVKEGDKYTAHKIIEYVRKTEDFSLSGKITGIGENHILVNGTKIMTADTTKFYDKDGNEVEKSYLTVGMYVKVKGSKTDDVKTASTITETETPSEPFTLTGIISAIGDAHIVVSGKKIVIDDNTKIYDAEGNLIGFSSLKTGMTVLITGNKTGDSYIAVTIKVKNAEQKQFELTGVLTDIRTDGITVGHTIIKVTTDTKVYDTEGNPIALSDLKTGWTVKVVGTRSGDTYTATTITVIRTSSEETYHYQGKVVSVSDVSVVVDKSAFTINADTKFYNSDGTVAALSDIKAGLSVTVYYKYVDGAMVAIKIIIAKSEQNRYCEYKGKITAITDSTITIGDKTFRLSSSAKFYKSDGTECELSDLQAGMNIVIKAEAIDGAWVVTYARITDLLDGDKITLYGVISDITDHSVIVCGKEFAIDGNTVIYLADGTTGTFADLAEGQYVEISAVVGSGNFTAIYVKIKNHDKGREENKYFSVKGAITALTETTVTIGDKVINFGEGTAIMFDFGLKVDASCLKVGLIVEVTGTVGENDVLTATKIIIKTGDCKAFVIVKDYITALTANTITAHGKVFTVTDATLIFDVNGNKIDINGLVTGNLAYICGMYNDDSVLTALYVKVYLAHDNQYVVTKGKIAELTETSVTVNDKAFTITVDTKIYKADGTAGTIADLATGTIVEIKGVYDADKNLIASIIKILPTCTRTGKVIALKGLVKEVGTDYIIINDKKIGVDAQTLFYLANGEATDISSITAGLLVSVKASYTSDTTLLALKVCILNQDECHYLELHGQITELGDNYLIVNNTKFYVSALTVYYDENDNPIAFGDLTTEMTVFVKAVFVNNGYLAVKVKKVIKDEIPGIIYRSSVTDIEEGLLYSDYDDYVTDEETTVEDINMNPLTLADLKVGMVVGVTADIVDGVRYARAVTVIEGRVSVDEDNGTLFNIATTPNPCTEKMAVTLSLGEESDVAISLYNSHGSLAAVIFEGKATAGVNSFSINAANYPSGMYYLAVTINGMQQIKKIEVIR